MSDQMVVDSPKPHFLDRVGLRGFPWVTAFVLYTISYGWFWNVRNSFWCDDYWAFYYPGIPENWHVMGFPKWIFLNKWLYELIGPGFMRLVIFVVFFISAICFYGISRKISYLNEQLRKFATLLFLLLPFNTTRVTLMVFHYTTAYFWFFLAWYLIVTFKSIWIKLLAASLFFLSFQMYSLPVFFALPILHLLNLEEIKDSRQLFLCIRKNLFLIIVSPVYVVLRWFFWNSKSAGLHNPSMPQLFLLGKILLAPGLIVILILVFAKYRFVEKRATLYLVAISLFAIFLGLAPYIAYGSFHGPVAVRPGIGLFRGYWTYFLGDSNWQDRFLILQPFGVSLLICSLLYFIPLKIRRVQLFLQIMVISICVLINTGFGFEFIVDYAKQKEVVSELRNVGFDSTISEYVIIDRATHLNARGHPVGDWLYLVPIAYGVAPERVSVSNQCISSNGSRLVVIDGKKSYWKALRNWISQGDFGFSVEILDSPILCTPDLVENSRMQNQIPLLLYFNDTKKSLG